jgi:hypothetical protein
MAHWTGSASPKQQRNSVDFACDVDVAKNQPDLALTAKNDDDFTMGNTEVERAQVVQVVV